MKTDGGFLGHNKNNTLSSNFNHGVYPERLRDSIYLVVPLRMTVWPGHISAGWLLAIYMLNGNDVLGGLCRAPGVLSEVTASHTFPSLFVLAQRGSFCCEENLSPFMFFERLCYYS